MKPLLTLLLALIVSAGTFVYAGDKKETRKERKMRENTEYVTKLIEDQQFIVRADAQLYQRNTSGHYTNSSQLSPNDPQRMSRTSSTNAYILFDKGKYIYHRGSAYGTATMDAMYGCYIKDVKTEDGLLIMEIRNDKDKEWRCMVVTELINCETVAFTNKPVRRIEGTISKL